MQAIHVKDVLLGQVQALQSHLTSGGSTEDMAIKEDFKIKETKDSVFEVYPNSTPLNDVGSCYVYVIITPLLHTGKAFHLECDSV